MGNRWQMSTSRINKNSDGVQTFFRDFISALANKQTAYTIQEVKTKIFNS